MTTSPELCAVAEMWLPAWRRGQTLAPLLTAEEGARWEKLELDSALLRMADVAVCKRCGTHCLEDADNCAMCSKCLFVFCSLCQESWHPGTQVAHLLLCPLLVLTSAAGCISHMA